MRTIVLAAFLLTAITAWSESAPQGDATSQELDAARKLQTDADRLGEELTSKMLELELEYHKRKEPLLKERNKLLSAIPNFWATIISRHPNRHAWLHGDDEDILKYLVDVEVGDMSRDEGVYYPLHTFRISMKFRPNPYFANTIIYRDVKGGMDDASVSGINWLEGKAPLQASFFNFFESGGMVGETRGRLQDHTRHEIAHVFRYEFWQNPFTYYDQPTYHDYQHMSEEQHSLYEEQRTSQHAGEHEQHYGGDL